MIQDGVTAGLLPQQPLEERLDAIISAATSTCLSKPLTRRTKQLQSCLIKKQLRQEAKRGRKRSNASRSRAFQAPTIAAFELPTSSSQDDDSDDMDFSSPRKSRFNTPQLQAQLSRLAGRTRLRRLKDTLHSKGAREQVTRIEDLCHTHVSHKWLYHLDACAGRVLTPQDSRSWTGPGECRSCGCFLNPHLEHADTCSTAEATRGHYACVQALVCDLKLEDPGITAEPRGLTASQSRPADIFTTVSVPGRSAALDVCVASPNAAQLEETQRRQPSIVNSHIIEAKFQNCMTKVFTIAPLFGRQTDGHTQQPPRTFQYAADIAANRNGQPKSAKSLQRRWKHQIQIALLRRRAAMSRAVLPNPSLSGSMSPRRGLIDRAVQHWGYAPPLDGGPGDHNRQAHSETE